MSSGINHRVSIHVGANNLTGRIDRRRIEGLVAQYFDGFTLSTQTGYWRGRKERSLRIDVLGGGPRTLELAEVLAGALSQEAVLVERVAVSVDLVGWQERGAAE